MFFSRVLEMLIRKERAFSKSNSKLPWYVDDHNDTRKQQFNIL